jgi:hypothetical protein
MDGHHLGIAAVGVPTGEGRREAEVLGALAAEPAYPAGACQPRCPYPFAELEPGASGPKPHNLTDYLMAGNPSDAAGRQVSFGEMKIGAADTAGAD